MELAVEEDRVELSALLAIEDAGLPHLSSALLRSFVQQAVEPMHAASYLNTRLGFDDPHAIVSDWVYIVECLSQNGDRPPPPDTATCNAIRKRDAHRCCITGKSGSIWDPLMVVPILSLPTRWLTNKPHISEMLSAFLGPYYRDWWLSQIAAPERILPEQIHWLVRKSAAQAYVLGKIKLDRLQTSMIEFEVNHLIIGPFDSEIQVDGQYALLGDHSRSGVTKVDARFIGTHSRLCRSVQYLKIANELAMADVSHLPGDSNAEYAQRQRLNSPSITHTRPLANFLGLCLLELWTMFPMRLRAYVYGRLKRLGEYLYENDRSMAVQRLPFGLYLKFPNDDGYLQNELNALRLVQTFTDVPVPRPLDKVTDSSKTSYLLMTRLPGFQLWQCQDILSDRDCEDIASQLQTYITQLRAIPHTHAPVRICNTLGQACQDHRIRSGDPIGPFHDEASFSSFLRYPDDPFRRGHEAGFTHADLNPRNILVNQYIRGDGRKGWRISGIVDWETAGYYPEYWEFTKAMFEGFRWPRRYNDMIEGVFGGIKDYSGEYAVEKRSWEEGDAV